jgi:transposase-like protein
MDGRPYEAFFLAPQDPLQRRYEALRGVLVDDESMAEVAQRLGLAPGTVRNWVCAFRQQWDHGEASPFFTATPEDVPQRLETRTRTTNRQP